MCYRFWYFRLCNDVTTAPIAAADKKTTEESMNAVLADAQWGETVEVNYETGDDNGTVITSSSPFLPAN